MISQHGFERRLQNMSAGMIGGNSLSSFFINNQLYRIADFYFSFLNNSLVDNKFINRLFGIRNSKDKTGPFQEACIAHLSAGFTVKRRSSENDLRFLSFLRALHGLSIYEDSGDFRLRLNHAFIAAKFTDNSRTRSFQITFSNRFLAAALPGAAGSDSLLFHLGIKAVIIQSKAIAFDDVRRQICGKAESIVEFKNQGTGENRFSRLAQCHCFFLQDAQPRVECFHKTLFFIKNNFSNVRGLFHQIRINAFHHINDYLRALMQKWFVDAQHFPVTRCPAQNTA